LKHEKIISEIKNKENMAAEEDYRKALNKRIVLKKIDFPFIRTESEWQIF